MLDNMMTLLYGPLMAIAYNVHRIFLAIVLIMIKSSFYVISLEEGVYGPNGIASVILLR
jgi:hypothetical protein